MNCYLIESGPSDDDTPYCVRALAWLVAKPEQFKMMYIPSLQQLEGTYFTSAIGFELGHNSKNLRLIKYAKQDIHLITNDMMEKVDDPVRLFACSCDDDSLTRMEQMLNIKDILVFPWNPEHDVNGWKEKYHPQKIELDS